VPPKIHPSRRVTKYHNAKRIRQSALLLLSETEREVLPANFSKDCFPKDPSLLLEKESRRRHFVLRTQSPSVDRVVVEKKKKC
jgi:hypothetical protein